VDEGGGKGRGGGPDGRQMSRAARLCDSFNQSLGCVPLGPEANYVRSCYEASQPRYTASCQTLANVTALPTRRYLRISFPELPILALRDVVDFCLPAGAAKRSHKEFPTLHSPSSMCFSEISFGDCCFTIFANF